MQNKKHFFLTNQQFHRDMSTRHCQKKNISVFFNTFPFMYGNKKITIKRRMKRKNETKS